MLVRGVRRAREPLVPQRRAQAGHARQQHGRAHVLQPQLQRGQAHAAHVARVAARLFFDVDCGMGMLQEKTKY